MARKTLKSNVFLTDYFIYEIDVERCYTLLTVQEGDLYYLPSVGINYQQFITSEISFTNDTVASFIQQEAIKEGVAISNIEISEQNYTLQMIVSVLPTYGSEQKINIEI